MLFSALKMEVGLSSETCISTRQGWRHIPRDHILMVIAIQPHALQTLKRVHIVQNHSLQLHFPP